MPEYAEDKMCTCGCPASEHHQVWYMGGGHSYDECESYGWNEFGGMMPEGFISDSDGLLYVRWVDHCQRFTPVAIPLGPIGSTSLTWYEFEMMLQIDMELMKLCL